MKGALVGSRCLTLDERIYELDDENLGIQGLVACIYIQPTTFFYDFFRFIP